MEEIIQPTVPAESDKRTFEASFTDVTTFLFVQFCCVENTIPQGLHIPVALDFNHYDLKDISQAHSPLTTFQVPKPRPQPILKPSCNSCGPPHSPGTCPCPPSPVHGARNSSPEDSDSESSVPDDEVCSPQYQRLVHLLTFYLLRPLPSST